MGIAVKKYTTVFIRDKKGKATVLDRLWTIVRRLPPARVAVLRPPFTPLNLFIGLASIVFFVVQVV